LMRTRAPAPDGPSPVLPARTLPHLRRLRRSRGGSRNLWLASVPVILQQVSRDASDPLPLAGPIGALPAREATLTFPARCAPKASPSRRNRCTRSRYQPRRFPLPLFPLRPRAGVHANRSGSLLLRKPHAGPQGGPTVRPAWSLPAAGCTRGTR